jgi:xylulokinase
MSGTLVLGCDVGTTNAKVGLFRLGERIELVAQVQRRYALAVLDGGGVEQDPDDWWRALCEGTREVLATAGCRPDDVRAISFSSQMQGLVLVDGAGRPVRPAMSYLDGRAMSQYRRGIKSGLKVAGLRASLLVPSLVITGGVSASVKDPVWKYLWVREQEPEVFARARYWLDVKDYLGLRCTGRAAMTDDSAHATFLYDTRPGKRRFSAHLCRAYGVELRHLPEVVSGHETLGPLTPAAAAELGLTAGTTVVAGGGDLTMTALGCGCVEPGDTHVYVGTSGWVSSVTAERLVDVDHFMASILGALPGRYNYIGEQETSGKCLEWARDHLCLDGVGLYDGARHAEGEAALEAMVTAAAGAPAGAGGVVFAPWMHGNRSPFEDPHARGVFFNVGLQSTKAQLVRAVLEGMLLQKRWLLECMAAKTAIREPLRFAGGGACSDVTGQLLADVTGRPVDAVAEPRSVGAMGAAALCGIALGVMTPAELKTRVPVRASFTPDPARHAAYERSYGVFKKLHKANRKLFSQLNA